MHYNINIKKMKLISIEKFRSENKSSILDLKKTTDVYGGDPPGLVDSTQHQEHQSTQAIGGGDTDCQDRWVNDAGGVIIDWYNVF